MAQASLALAAALRHHHAGQLREAESGYRALLRRQPRHSEAQNLLGLARFQQRDYPGAIAALRRAVALRPEPEYLRNLGMALRADGQPEAALAAYRQSAALQPGAAETQFNLGNLLAAMERPAEAEAAFRAALAARPDHAASWQNLGGALLALRRETEAAAALEQALRLAPAQAATLYNLGLARERQGAWAAAAEAFAAARRLDGTAPEAALHHGHCLQEMADWPGAEAAFREATTLAPDHAGAQLALAAAQQHQGRPAEAAAAFARAVALRPAWRDAQFGLAGALEAMGEAEAAIAALRAVLAIAPDDAEALTGLGNLLSHQGDPEAALDCCARAVALAPTDANARATLARQLLMLGRFGEGWDMAEARWARGDPRHDLGLPGWDGRPLPEGRILVWREQGIGDEVMFAGLLPELLAAGHRLTLLCDPRLRPAFARAFPGVAFHTAGNPAPELRAQIPIGDLPRLLRRRESDFAAARPYLTADPQHRAALRRRYADGRPLVGITWATRNPDASRRNMPLAALAPLLRDPGLRCVSLQYGDAAALAREAAGLPLLIDPEVNALASVEDALAQAAAMDLVVGIDNSTIHFAGALGVPCRVLLPHDAEWRWMTRREDTPWYPATRLLRQQRGESWSALVARVAGPLASFAKNIGEGTREACEK